MADTNGVTKHKLEFVIMYIYYLPPPPPPPLGTAAPNSNTINIILHNNSYLPAVQWPKRQQISKHQNII